MTHMHIPDGILPVWLCGFIVMSIVLAFALYRLRTVDVKKKIPLPGGLTSAMLVGISISILPGYHINFSVITGILVGSGLGLMNPSRGWITDPGPNLLRGSIWTTVRE